MFFASNNPAEAYSCKSQDSLIKFIDSIEEGFELLELIFDKQGNVVDFVFLRVNPAYEKQTGLKSANIIGKRKREIVPESEQRWYDYAAKAVKTAKILKYEYYNDKVNRYFDTQFIPISTNQIAVIFKDIIERKKAEEKLISSEMALEEAQAVAHLGSWKWDLKNKRPEWSAEMYRIYGVDPDSFEITPENTLKLTYAEDREFVKRKQEQVLAKGIPASFDHRIVLPNGELRWVHVETKARSTLQEKPSIIFGTVQDITERQKTEEALKQNEIKYRTVADFTYDWEHWISPEGKLIYVSPSCERITGFKPEEFIENPELITKIVHPDDKALIESHYKSINSTELPDVDYRIITKGGEVRWIAHGCQPVFDDKGKWLGRRGSNRDITERKKAEEALMESEERFQSLFEQSPTAFEIYDKNGLQIQTNHAWEKMWNVPREYTNGKFNIFESKQIVEMGLLPYVKKAYAGDTVLVPETPFDASLEPQTLGEGRKRWLRSIYYPIINVHGEVINLVVMHEDVTEKKNLEKQLQDNERMAAIGQTAGMIGHDIRNPLQAIVSELFLARQVMIEGPKNADTKEVLESIDLIHEQVDYINKIVADLQDYAKPLKAEYADVDIEDLLVKVFERVVVPDNVKLYFNVKGTVRLKTDATFMQRALTNLVNNALQAMPDGGELGLSAQKEEECVVICVSDTGQGIPESVKANLFTPLTTTKAKGQGLGLAVVKRLVEALNGKVSFESEEGKGTKFIIELPAQG